MTTVIDRRSVPQVLLTAGAVFAAQSAFAESWQGVGEFVDASIRGERAGSAGGSARVVSAS